MDKPLTKAIPSLPRVRRKSMTVTHPPLVAQQTSSTCTNKRSSSSIDLLLSIPDPPTPDERLTAKTAAVALSLRGRRKSGSFFVSAPSKPFFDVTNHMDKLDAMSRENAVDEDQEIGKRPPFDINDSNMDLVEDVDNNVFEEDRETSVMMGEMYDHSNDTDRNDAGDVGDDIEFDENTGICFLDDGEEDVIDFQESPEQLSSDDIDEEEELGVDSSRSRKRPRQSIMIPDLNELKANVIKGLDSTDVKATLQDDLHNATEIHSKSEKQTKNVDNNIVHHNKDLIDENVYNHDHNINQTNVCHSQQEHILKSNLGESYMAKGHSETRSPGKENVIHANMKNYADMDEVKSAIRRYCKLSPKERFQSEDAVFVEQKTGYPLLTAMDHFRRRHIHRLHVLTEEEYSSVSNSIRRDVISTLKQLYDVIGEKKKIECKLLEECTGCRSERRKGKYQYESISTGHKVKASDYEKKYLKMLEDQKRERMQYLTISKCESAIRDDTICPEDTVQSSTVLNVTGSYSDEQSKLSDVLNSIPDRDDLSSDPEVAEAQRKLYNAFDVALREYSDTIFAIRRRRGENVIHSLI